jgi:hypothetical protein
MSRLRPEKLHVRFAEGSSSNGPLVPRRYTLTHSDRTGELFLSIGPDYDQEQLRGWQARLMRDEVLAEWSNQRGQLELHIHCHVSGEWALGPAGWRDAIFRHELPLALEALCYGDRELLCHNDRLKERPVWVHFHARQAKYDVSENWGIVADYLPPTDQTAGL